MKKRISAALLSMGRLMISAARAEDDPVVLQMQHMTLREKVGQLFMIRPDALEGRFGRRSWRTIPSPAPPG